MRSILTTVAATSLLALGCGDEFTSNGDGGGATTTTTSTSSGGGAGGAGGGGGGGGAGMGGGGAGGGMPQHCGAGSVAELVDDFDGIELNSALWLPVTTAFANVDGGGMRLTLVVNLGPDPPPYRSASIASVAGYRLTNCAMFVQAFELPVPSNADMYFGAGPGPLDHFVEVVYSNGYLHLLRKDNDGLSASNPILHMDGDHAWWRLREEGGTVYLDASGDGTSWMNLTSISNSLDLSNATVFLGVGADPGGTGTAVGKFDNFNVVP